MRHFFLCVCALGIVACGESPDPSIYASKDLWLCRPDIENDRCDQADLSTTEIWPDGTSVVSEVIENPDAKVDCFYVYHTVDWSTEPGNTEPLSPHPDVVEALFRNGAHYRGACRMFAPLYRQMTLETYYDFPIGGWKDTEFFQAAYDDVVEAFEYYMRRHNAGRDFVLIGHSQGTHVLTKLIQDKFDDDEALRGQLVSALLIGPGGAAQVPEGDRIGGSFTNIPLCTSASETGCVIAFDANPAVVSTVLERAVPIFPPMVRGCVNPASFDDGPGTLAALIYARRHDHLIRFPDVVDTEWVRYPNIYTSRCSEETQVLEIDLVSEYTGQVPITPQDLQESLVDNWGLNRNLHLAEYFIANTDLVRIVEQQIASREN